MDLRQYTREFKTNITIAIPVMLGQLGNVLVGFADNIMVGELGAPALAAVSLANSIFFILMGLGIGFSFAITPLIAESDGAKNYLEGKKNYQHGVVLSTLLGIVLTLILLAIQEYMHQMNQPEEVVILALPYYKIIAYSMIPLLIFQAIKQFTDGLSQTKYAMIAILVANSINVLLNYLLIYGKWGAPKLGIDGAAYGTLISRVLMIFILLYYIAKNKAFAPYRLAVSWFHLEKKRVVQILKLGYPAAFQMFFEVSIFASSVLLAGLLGTQAQAANQIALNLSTMTFMIATGMSVTATIRVGNQKGLKDYINLKRIALSTLFLMIIIAIIAAIGFMSLRTYLPWVYIEDKEVVNIAAKLLIVAGLFQISDGIQVVVIGALRGLQDMVVPMWMVFFAYWVVGFPFCYYLSIKTDLGTYGIWLGLLIGLTVASILLYFRFQQLTKRLILSNQTKD
ncbi:MATE family efflux transporter [Ochrovirga pacifica]|uniref:MATE family efflux transporter n=1 Tax=Ochrovirga pacifica TaxID=1042376 RepID=UPI0002557FBB